MMTSDIPFPPLITVSYYHWGQNWIFDPLVSTFPLWMEIYMVFQTMLRD